jgi:hypothetical protein
MTINIPVQYNTDLFKVQYLYRLYELLRVDGNANGWDNDRIAKKRRFSLRYASIGITFLLMTGLAQEEN